MDDFLTRGVFADEIVTMPVDLGSNWSWSETAAAIRANIEKQILYTFLTESAFKSADHGIFCFWRKGLVTILASGPEF